MTTDAPVAQASEAVELSGHIIDSGLFTGIIDEITAGSAQYDIEQFQVGRTHDDPSYLRMLVSAPTPHALDRLLGRLQAFGMNPVTPVDATAEEADADGVFPEGFYSTTNLQTFTRVAGRWVEVSNPEMDCGLLVEGVGDEATVRTVAVSDVRAGDQIVCGAHGVKVVAPVQDRQQTDEVFEFMNSTVSSEKPQALLVRRVADDMREARELGKRILWVAGPAVVHTGAADAMVALVEAGWVDVLFAGNALATHDIESSMYGTSLGVDLSKGTGVKHGHEHHIRAINRVRRSGSIAAAVERGVITGGVMHAMVQAGKPFVLVGSVRDDGPLPDVFTDVIEGQRAMRGQLPGVGYAIMVATMLHSIATGNILPASIPLVSVDINPATAVKLADRGSAQATAIVTDIGLFLEQLAQILVPGYRTA